MRKKSKKLVVKFHLIEKSERKVQFLPYLFYSENYSYLLSLFPRLKFDTIQGSQTKTVDGFNSLYASHCKTLHMHCIDS